VTCARLPPPKFLRESDVGGQPCHVRVYTADLPGAQFRRHWSSSVLVMPVASRVHRILGTPPAVGRADGSAAVANRKRQFTDGLLPSAPRMNSRAHSACASVSGTATPRARLNIANAESGATPVSPRTQAPPTPIDQCQRDIAQQPNRRRAVTSNYAAYLIKPRGRVGGAHWIDGEVLFPEDSQRSTRR
jgi:hypothetical protein